LAIPFKVRFGADRNLRIDTNVNIGGYVGWKFRMTHVRPYYISAVAAGGLALLPLNESSPDNASTMENTVVGLTGSIGVVFQLADFQLGLLVGIDHAAGDAGAGWAYNDKQWISVSLGYAFFGNSPPTHPK
jgi:hypothetical protein